VCRNLTDGWRYQIKLNRQAELLEHGREKKSISGKQARDKQLGVLSIVGYSA
jgi:hypothetical protein